MASFDRLKRRTLPSPPPADDASDNLVQPEHAPAVQPSPTLPPAAAPSPSHHEAPARLDGRSMRRSNRVVQFATRVTPEFDRRIRGIAQRDQLLIVEVLERALEAYEQAR